MVIYINTKTLNMGRDGKLLQNARGHNNGNGRLLLGVPTIYNTSKIERKPQRRGDVVPDPLNLPPRQTLILASQPQYDIFASETNIANVLSKDNNFKIKVATNMVGVLKSCLLELVIYNPSLDTALELPMFVHDPLKHLLIHVDGKEQQKIDFAAAFIAQRALLDDQLDYEQTLKPGIVFGANLEPGESRRVYLPIDCVLTLNEIYSPGLKNEIVFTIFTQAQAWPGTAPQLAEANIIVHHIDYAIEQQDGLAKKYLKESLDFKFYESQTTSIAMTSILPSTTYTYALSGLNGLVNSLNFVLKPSTSAVISEWCTDQIASWELLDAGGNNIHGNKPIRREYYEKCILHDRKPVRLIDPDLNDKFIAMDFGDFRADFTNGSLTGFEVLNSTHKLRITTASTLTAGSYEMDVISWHLKSLNIKDGICSVSS